MNTALSSSIRASGSSSRALTNWGKNARTKIDSLGLRTLIRTASVITWAAVRGARSALTVRAPRSRSVAQAM